MLEITNLSKQYKNNADFSIKDVSFKVEEGEIFGFLGPNGAGKSTTIKCVTGILPYNIGNIKICGYDLQEQPIKAKQEIGYVPDNHMMYESLTAREYVNFVSDIFKVG
ncbi:MAG: ATP-binding cassette domain-containing protein, partial [Clostridia bacterium]